MKIHRSQITYMVGDFFTTAAAAILTVVLRSETDIFRTMPQWVLITALTILGSFTVLTGLILGSYKSIWVYVGFSEIIRQAFIVTLHAIVAFSVNLLLKSPLSVSAIILYWILLNCLTCGIRMISRFYSWLSTLFGARNGVSKRTIVIGAGAAGSMIVNRLCANTSDGLYPVAILDDDKSKQGKRLSGVEVCGYIRDVRGIAEKYDADAILIAIPSATKKQLEEIYDHCLKTNLPVKIFQSVVDGGLYMHGRNYSISEVPLEKLLSRDTFVPNVKKISSFVMGKTILVTGGAGSIGAELCHQVLQYGCRRLVIFDIDENGLFKLNEKLRRLYLPSRYTLCIGSIQDESRINELFLQYRPQIVFHAAAHKHVPLMESNVAEAVKNNVFGTRKVISACIEHGVSKFILISTDKAVHPTSVMGATKRVAELQVQQINGKGCEMAAVRFGNVLGSNGSVVPTFREQIAAGGPVTVTHEDITRFFMTIPEAVSLVLCAGSQAKGGEIFILDMGKPIRIYDLACRMIKLSGFEPNVDIPIEIVGLRPGEKLYEELAFSDESIRKTESERIFVLSNGNSGVPELDQLLKELQLMLIRNCGAQQIKDLLFTLAAPPAPPEQQAHQRSTALSEAASPLAPSSQEQQLAHQHLSDIERNTLRSFEDASAVASIPQEQQQVRVHSTALSEAPSTTESPTLPKRLQPSEHFVTAVTAAPKTTAS